MDTTGNDNNEQKPEKKSVGFAEEPNEELWEHHKDVRKAQDERAKSNPFHKIPPELAHLEKKGPGPKPLPTYGNESTNAIRRKLGNKSTLGDLRYQAVKDISIQNKDTELNFHYPKIKMPMSANEVLVDIKYGSLNSFDMSKINSYLMNVSDIKIGLGYEFSGTIVEVGSSFEDGEYAVGDNVVGIIHPMEKKGALSSSLVIVPGRDILLKVENDDMNKLAEIDPVLSFEKPDENENFEIESSSSDSNLEEVLGISAPPKEWEEELTPLAKICIFPVLYCRAKQALSHSESVFKKNCGANILINGADTNLGLTLIQLLTSPLYKHLKELNLILIVREKNMSLMDNFLKSFKVGPRVDPERDINFSLLSFDLENDDIVLPGEKVPINYKKPDLFASEVLNALLEVTPEAVNALNVHNYKLDSFIDIIGCKKYFQTSSIKFKHLDSIQLPVHSRIASDTTLSEIFAGNVKEPFLVKILKPKSWGSCLVSCCSFYVLNPTYNIDEAIPHTALNPYSYKWTGSFLNSSFFTKYNYYDDTKLTTKEKWLREGYSLFLDGGIKFKIDSCFDWRNDFKKHLRILKKDDCKVILKVETF